jgi:hypothetical protein
MLDDVGKPVLVEIKNPVSTTYDMKEPPPPRPSKKRPPAKVEPSVEATLPPVAPLKTIEHSKGEHYGSHSEYIMQVQMQMEATLQRLHAKVCDFMPYWRFSDMFLPKYDAETGHFLIANMHASRYYYSAEFVDRVTKELQEFKKYCEDDVCPPEIDKDDMLARFPALKVLSLAEVKIWVEPRTDEHGQYIYGGKTSKGVPLPEIEMGEYEGKPYMKRVICKRRYAKVIIPNSSPRYVTAKEISQGYYDTPAEKEKQEKARQKWLVERQVAASAAAEATKKL